MGEKRYGMGNVRMRKMIDIWNSPGWDWLREDYRPKLRLCNDCNFFDNCFYGKTCRANPGYLFRDEYGVSPECILEYKALGLPLQKVLAYLDERSSANADNLRIQALCARLKSEVLESAREEEHPPAEAHASPDRND